MLIQYFMKNMRQFYRENGKNMTVKIEDLTANGGMYHNLPVNGIRLETNPKTGEKSLILTTK